MRPGQREGSIKVWLSLFVLAVLQAIASARPPHPRECGRSATSRTLRTSTCHSCGTSAIPSSRRVIATSARGSSSSSNSHTPVIVRQESWCSKADLRESPHYQLVSTWHVAEENDPPPSGRSCSSAGTRCAIVLPSISTSTVSTNSEFGKAALALGHL